MTTFFYLHGWCSSPKSSKAQVFKQYFKEVGFNLQIPDLNQGDFYHLTLTRQIQQVQALLPNTPVTLIGSSLGGLVALWVAKQQPQVERLVLLAPSLDFQNITLLGESQLSQWRFNKEMLVYHYSEERELLLSYDFIEDFSQYSDNDLQRALPTLILHGKNDEVIPIQNARDFAATRPWIKLIEFDSDHRLTDVQTQLWQEIKKFCQI